MRNRRGSALILAMFLLVLFSGIGMYVVSLPVTVADTAGEYHRAAVARNMAEAGVHAAIARFPAEIPERAPIERDFQVGSGMTAGYKTHSAMTGVGRRGAASVPGSGYNEYVVVSEGGVTGAAGGRFRVRALVRYGPLPPAGRKGGGGKPSPSPRARILEWAGSHVP